MKALEKVQEVTAISVYGCNGIDPLIEKIEAEVRGVVPDLSTAKGRKEIASLAFKVSQSKVALDKLGLDLVGDWKAKAKAVDVERKAVRDRLDALRDEVRKPLTDWEKAEADRIAAEKLEKEISEAYDFALLENELFDKNKEIERAEQERLAKEEKDRLEKEAKAAAEARIKREEEIAKAAAENARIEAAELARKEREEQERKIADAVAAEEKAKRDKEEAEKAAEARRIADVAAAEKAAKDEADAKELARLTEEKRIADEDAARAKDVENRRHVNNLILAKMAIAGISEEAGKEFIKMILLGDVPNTTIKY